MDIPTILIAYAKVSGITTVVALIVAAIRYRNGRDR